MILVDTGVLIDFLRTKDRKLDGLFRSLAVAVCGVSARKSSPALAPARIAKGCCGF